MKILNKIILYLINQVYIWKIKKLSPIDGDVILIECNDRDQAVKMAHDISDSKIMQGIPIIVLQNECKLNFLREMPDEFKDKVKKWL
jgi:nitrogen regulatory protein PII-like uncharacterized protein